MANKLDATPLNSSNYFSNLLSEDDANEPPKKKWNKTWWGITLIVISTLVAIFAFTLWMVIIFADYGQCTRSCRLEFCNTTDSECFIHGNIKGSRISKTNRMQCKCAAPKLFKGTKIINRYSPATDTWELDNKTLTFCAIPQKDNFTGPAKTYPSKEDAIRDGAFLLHKGACGQCSNKNDFEVYNFTSHSLTHSSTMGAFISIFSKKGAYNKMISVGLSSGCSDCWVENMRHTIIHCFGRCMRAGSRKSCDKNGELADCLLCDEVHSGVFFRECAGMTRRRAGIVTDICRKPSEIN